MNIKLSVCIPTYNRAAFLEETIESILSQATDDIEIVISDNCSQDNTGEIIRQLQQKFGQITYFKWDENKGADLNYLKVVELAKGEYCWLLGSDDALIPGAIGTILSEINYGCDIYLCDRWECTYSLQPIRKKRWLDVSEDRMFDFSNQQDVMDYFNKATSIGAVFSYLSSIIVKRSAWNSVRYDVSMTGTAYSHAYILVSLITKGAKLKYLRDAKVLCRSWNDSFSSDGLVSRYLLDFNGYLGIADKLFLHQPTRKMFLKIMTREHRWFRLLKLRSHIRDAREWMMIKKLLIDIGYSPVTLALCGFLGRFRKLIVLAVLVRKKATAV